MAKLIIPDTEYSTLKVGIDNTSTDRVLIEVAE